MTIKVAINGYGRIGRNILRAIYEANRNEKIKVVAINDLGDVQTNVHLTRYDSVHGRFTGDVSAEGDHMVVNNDKIRIVSERNPSVLPWGEMDVDIVYECTGLFASRDKAAAHLEAGAKKVIISAPGGNDVDATVVYGVNHHVLKAEDQIISNASCTTNCLAPLAKPLHEHFGISTGLMTTIHAYTNDQVLIDAYHSDIRRARSATASMIPTKTGAAAAVGLVLPELAGKLDGYSVRVPTMNVSLVDLNFVADKPVSIDAVNRVIKDAAEGDLRGVLDYTEEALVSIDFNHNPASSTFDATQTRVQGNLVKVLAWYDNEWGFSNRMLDVTEAWMAV